MSQGEASGAPEWPCGWAEQGPRPVSPGPGVSGRLALSGTGRPPRALCLKCRSALCAPGALLEKKVDMDKRGLGVTDYNGMVTKALGCRPPTSKESSVDRPTFLDKVWIEVALPV